MAKKSGWIDLVFIGATQKKNLSFKRWGIKVVGREVHTRWGRVGATLRTMVKKCKDAKAAEKSAMTQMRSKLRKGYRLAQI